ncbi:MAG: alpha/beta hydrolase [Bacteroidetes bacterium]|nr:alpha/beta hydrolase [Bacteroidota bacterium]
MNLDLTKINLSIEGSNKKKITLDITLPISKVKTPVVIFCHGFKGFKDWGHFNWISNAFAKQGLAFLKFNFSYNGTTEKQLIDLSDLEAFGNNNYQIEYDDLGLVIDYVEKECIAFHINKNEIYLAAHSRGGGIAILRTSEDKRIKKLALWASLSEFESFFRPETIKKWQADGAVYATNKRTNQELPLYKQFYDNYIENKSKLDVPKAALLISAPMLIIHGDNDEAVNISHAEALYEIVQHSIFIKVENGDHTFGAKHPFNEATDVTEMLEELVENTVEFFID